MSDWTEMESGALKNFLVTPGPLKSGLEKFIADSQHEEEALCAAAMATVPRNPEIAADHAAKAQLLGEFWARLEDALTSFPMSSTGANPDEEEV